MSVQNGIVGLYEAEGFAVNSQFENLGWLYDWFERKVPDSVIVENGETLVSLHHPLPYMLPRSQVLHITADIDHPDYELNDDQIDDLILNAFG